MDIFADSAFVVSITMILTIKGEFHFFIPICMFVKLAVFILTSRFLTKSNKSIFDSLGRKTAVFYYVLPCIHVVGEKSNLVDIDLWVLVIEMVCVILTVITLHNRMLLVKNV